MTSFIKCSTWLKWLYLNQFLHRMHCFFDFFYVPWCLIMEYIIALGKNKDIGLDSIGLIPLLCHLEPHQPSGRAVLSFIARSSRSSYVDEDCDSLALCDPVQRMNYDVDSLPESCFDSGLSTLRDSNEYDSEVEYKHQRGFQRSHGMQESFRGDASDTDVSPEVTASSPRPALLSSTETYIPPCLSFTCHGHCFKGYTRET